MYAHAAWTISCGMGLLCESIVCMIIEIKLIGCAVLYVHSAMSARMIHSRCRAKEEAGKKRQYSTGETKCA